MITNLYDFLSSVELKRYITEKYLSHFVTYKVNDE